MFTSHFSAPAGAAASAGSPSPAFGADSIPSMVFGGRGGSGIGGRGGRGGHLRRGVPPGRIGVQRPKPVKPLARAPADAPALATSLAASGAACGTGAAGGSAASGTGVRTGAGASAAAPPFSDAYKAAMTDMYWELVKDKKLPRLNSVTENGPQGKPKEDRFYFISGTPRNGFELVIPSEAIIAPCYRGWKRRPHNIYVWKPKLQHLF